MREYIILADGRASFCAPVEFPDDRITHQDPQRGGGMCQVRDPSLSSPLPRDMGGARGGGIW